MLIRDLEDIKGSDDEVEDEQWISRRLLLRRDGMGYSVHETIIKPDEDVHMWYQHHVEAVLCIEGEGEVEDLTEGGVHKLRPGVLYGLDKHQKHILRASKKGLRLFCVFNPSLVGPETHNAEGSYALLEDDGSVIKA